MDKPGKASENEGDIDQDDLLLVMGQAKCSRAAAIRALRASRMDPVEACIYIEEAQETDREGGPASRFVRVAIEMGTDEDEARFRPFAGHDPTPMSTSQPAEQGHNASADACASSPLPRDEHEPPATAGTAGAVASSGRALRAGASAGEGALARGGDRRGGGKAGGWGQVGEARGAGTRGWREEGDCREGGSGWVGGGAIVGGAFGGGWGGTGTNVSGAQQGTSRDRGPGNKTELIKSLRTRRNDAAATASYLLNMDSSQLPRLLGAAMDESDMMEVMRAVATCLGCSDCNIETRHACFRVIEGIRKVPRSNITVAMLGKKERTEVDALLESLKPSAQDAYREPDWRETTQALTKWP